MPLSRLLPVLAALALLLPACMARSEGANPLRIVCTTGMVADLVRNVAGDRAKVVALLGEGVDPHLYKPTRADIASLASADVVFYNGLLLEGKMTDALVRVASSGRKVHAVTEMLDEASLIEPDGAEGHPDPHVWMDPRAWSAGALAVRDRLIEADPAGADAYRANADAYVARLLALDRYAEETLATIPASARVLVTAHDAFNYFGRRYNFEVVGIQGISTESEAGLRDVERLVSLICDRAVPAVFVESTVSSRGVEALIAGARARGHAVRVGGQLYSDAMGPPGTPAGTYVGMIEHNVNTIAASLGGRVPAGGFASTVESATLAPASHGSP